MALGSTRATHSKTNAPAPRAPQQGAFIVFDTSNQLTSPFSSPSPSPNPAPVYVCGDVMSSFTLDARSLELLRMYQNVTAPSLGTKPLLETQRKMYPKMLFSVSHDVPFHLSTRLDHHHTYLPSDQSPCLMHAVLAIAAAHEIYLAGPLAPPCPRRRQRESFHRLQCASLFNRKLSQLPLRPEDRDPLWGTAALLSVLAFVETDWHVQPEESWPSRAPSAADLEWVRMGDGKMAVWHLTDPLRDDSIFREMKGNYAELHRPIPQRGVHGVSEELVALCELTPESSAEDSPYFNAAHTLARLQAHPKDEKLSPIQAFLFTSHMQMSFRKFLERKDPRALLILALWYQIARRACWYKERRADLERVSICLYLRKNHGDDEELMRMLPWDTDVQSWLGQEA
jgi:hypothetical protein